MGDNEKELLIVRKTDLRTRPFDMVILNETSRFHLALDALDQIPRLRAQATKAVDRFNAKLHEDHASIREHLQDMPEA